MKARQNDVSNTAALQNTARPQRDIDPNVRQRQAADPAQNIWVSASAGTGKTKVLTDRVLRLLLGHESIPPAEPHKILCLTFTKAAASEMALRINNTLARWSVAEEHQLQTELQNLLGHPPQAQEIAQARQLFARVIDTSGGLKIMTIHAFCQSVLSRFPLEAGLHPGFAALDDKQAAALLDQARTQTLSAGNPALKNAIDSLGRQLNETQLTGLIQNLTGERDQLSRLLDKNFGPECLYTKTCQHLGIPADKTPQDIAKPACENAAFDHANLQKACEVLCRAAAKTDRQKGEIIATWLSQTPQKRAQNITAYSAAFLTQKGEPHKTPISKKTTQTHPDILKIITTETARLQTLLDKQKACESAALTHALITLATDILERYNALKAQKAALDFDDLIFKTRALLQTSARWVLYKLDSGIDHILIDEAQDTNPEQWQIIEALSDEFFDGQGAQETTRTIFTVGDEKQSIYSFQRAAPEKFDAMRQKFSHKITQSRALWNNVDLNISFRSTATILEAVDAVFAQNTLSETMTAPPSHISFRRGQAGRVELWPLQTPQTKDQKSDPWAPPITITETTNPQQILADQIATQIRTWLDTGEKLPSHDRPIQPGDIMILARTRGALVNRIAKALKDQNIPISGMDRMTLSQEISIQDLLACAQFALLPNDDYTLACLLKSPLIGLSEEELYALAAPRASQSLWQALQNNPPTGKESIPTYLKTIIKNAAQLRPYDFFNRILNHPCPADPLSGLRAFASRLGQDIHEPLQEFLNITLDFETGNIPNLQLFLRWQRDHLGEVKREMEEAGQHIRIMTVHASKGLQAPIVFLPDTTRTLRRPAAQADARFLWPDKTELDIPLWTPRKDLEYETYKKSAALLQSRDDTEYRRLLYVAMTRAEDRLYVCAQTGKKPPLNDSWYFLVEKALKDHPQSFKDENGYIRLDTPQTQDPDRKSAKDKAGTPEKSAPAWLFTAAPHEKDAPDLMRPSQSNLPQNERRSPTNKSENLSFLRGNLTHKLLEILPDLSPENRPAAAQHFITQNAKTLPEATQKQIQEQTLSILNHAEFAPLFGPDSLAEVPVTAKLESGRILSGQIDRLRITDTDIWIIDYKTGQPPQSANQIPLAYQNQLRAYADTIAAIYPGRTLHCALLWTDGPILMPIPIETR